MSTLEDVADAFRKKVVADGGLSSGVLSFVFDDLGVVTINGGKSPNSVTASSNPDDAKTADCTIKLSVEALQALIQGKVSGTDAVSNGVIEITGDLRVAMAFGPAVGDLPRPVNELQFPFQDAKR